MAVSSHVLPQTGGNVRGSDSLSPAQYQGILPVLRLFGAPGNSAGIENSPVILSVIPAVYDAALQRNGLVWLFCLDVIDPSVNHGGPSVEL